MIDVNPEQLKTIVRILVEHVPECEARVFGSRVTRAAKDDSNLDLVVVGEHALDLNTLLRLKEAFEESDLPFRVDVVDWQTIGPTFQKVIEKKYEVVQKGKMKSTDVAGEWPLRTIADCASAGPYSTQIGPFGKALMANEYVDSGVPVLRGVNVNKGRFNDCDFVFINEHTADRLRKFESFPGDVLLVHKGTLGQIGIMPNRRKYARYIMGNSMLRVKCDLSQLLPEYLYYWLKSAAGQHYIFSRVSQVGVPQIQTPLSTLRRATLPVPPLSGQRAIAHILGTLDDKIDLNRRMNETLEAMARALFKSWFVDFDPVRAKVEGRDPGLPMPLANLFPDSFEDSELGEIPTGWEVQSFADTVQIIGGGTPKTSVLDFWNGEIPWFSVVDAPNGADVWVVDTRKKISREGVDNSSSQILPIGTTIISARGTVGQIALVGVPMAMNQSCYGLRGKVDKQGSFTYFVTREIVARLQQHAHGSVFATITRDTFAGVSVLLPPAEMLVA
jgi:type I restriction enzyme S subunit